MILELAAVYAVANTLVGFHLEAERIKCDDGLGDRRIIYRLGHSADSEAKIRPSKYRVGLEGSYSFLCSKSKRKINFC